MPSLTRGLFRRVLYINQMTILKPQLETRPFQLLAVIIDNRSPRDLYFCRKIDNRYFTAIHSRASDESRKMKCKYHIGYEFAFDTFEPFERLFRWYKSQGMQELEPIPQEMENIVYTITRPNQDIREIQKFEGLLNLPKPGSPSWLDNKMRTDWN